MLEGLVLPLCFLANILQSSKLYILTSHGLLRTTLR